MNKIEILNCFFKRILNNLGGFLYVYAKGEIIFKNSIIVNISSSEGTLAFVKTYELNCSINNLVMKNPIGFLFLILNKGKYNLKNFIIFNLTQSFGLFYQDIQLLISNIKIKLLKSQEMLIYFQNNCSVNLFNITVDEINLDKGGLAFIKENINIALLCLFSNKISLNYGGLFYALGQNCKIIAKNILCAKFTVKESGGIIYVLHKKHDFKLQNLYASEIIILSERGTLLFSEFENKISFKNLYFKNGLNKLKSGFIVLIKNNTINLYNAKINNVSTKEEGGLLRVDQYNFLNIENIYIQNLNSQFSNLGLIKKKILLN